MQRMLTEVEKWEIIEREWAKARNRSNSLPFEGKLGCSRRATGSNSQLRDWLTGRRRCRMHGGAPGIWRTQGATQRQLQTWPVHR
jgi:hypothetical protein